MHRVAQNPLHIQVMEGGHRFVAGLEIKDLAIAALPAAAGTERLPALIGAEEYNMIRIGHRERLAVGFLMLQLQEASIRAPAG